ncbi:MAG TPA: hypothetical protein VFQ45_22910 [Longimicrobium sp.]|nr:hypothetical protein [Longimicrobium sp.]
MDAAHGNAPAGSRVDAGGREVGRERVHGEKFQLQPVGGLGVQKGRRARERRQDGE